MEHVYNANVTYLSWEEIERLFKERLNRASKEGVITKRKIYDVTYDIVESIRYDNNGNSFKILDSWQDKYLERLDGDLWRVINLD